MKLNWNGAAAECEICTFIDCIFQRVQIIRWKSGWCRLYPLPHKGQCFPLISSTGDRAQGIACMHNKRLRVRRTHSGFLRAATKFLLFTVVWYLTVSFFFLSFYCGRYSTGASSMNRGEKRLNKNWNYSYCILLECVWVSAFLTRTWLSTWE